MSFMADIVRGVSGVISCCVSKVILFSTACVFGVISAAREFNAPNPLETLLPFPGVSISFCPIGKVPAIP